MDVTNNTIFETEERTAMKDRGIRPLDRWYFSSILIAHSSRTSIEFIARAIFLLKSKDELWPAEITKYGIQIFHLFCTGFQNSELCNEHNYNIDSKKNKRLLIYFFYKKHQERNRNILRVNLSK